MYICTYKYTHTHICKETRVVLCIYMHRECDTTWVEEPIVKPPWVSGGIWIELRTFASGAGLRVWGLGLGHLLLELGLGFGVWAWGAGLGAGLGFGFGDGRRL